MPDTDDADFDRARRYLTLDDTYNLAEAGMVVVEKDEVENLRQWKEGAIEVIKAWEEVWDALGQPGGLGSSKAAAALAEVQRLRALTAMPNYLDPREPDIDWTVGLPPDAVPNMLVDHVIEHGDEMGQLANTASHDLLRDALAIACARLRGTGEGTSRA